MKKLNLFAFLFMVTIIHGSSQKLEVAELNNDLKFEIDPMHQIAVYEKMKETYKDIPQIGFVIEDKIKEICNNNPTVNQQYLEHLKYIHTPHTFLGITATPTVKFLVLRTFMTALGASTYYLVSQYVKEQEKIKKEAEEKEQQEKDLDQNQDE